MCTEYEITISWFPHANHTSNYNMASSDNLAKMLHGKHEQKNFTQIKLHDDHSIKKAPQQSGVIKIKLHGKVSPR